MKVSRASPFSFFKLASLLQDLMRSCCAVSDFTGAVVGGLAVTLAGFVPANALAAHNTAVQASNGIGFIDSLRWQPIFSTAVHCRRFAGTFVRETD
jgi:hypothetical protein